MALYKVDSDTADLTKVAGGTLYADLPIGSWIKNDMATIPSGFLKEGDTISQSEYPELYAKYGSTVPYMADTSELSAYESLTVGTNAGSATTALYDGIFRLENGSCEGAGYYVSTDGGTTYSRVGASSGGGVPGHNLGTASTLFVKKGWKFYVALNSTSEPGGLSTGGYIAYYKKSLILKAKHTPVPADFMDAVEEAIDTSNIAKMLPYSFNTTSNIGAFNRQFVYQGHALTWIATHTGRLTLRLLKHGDGYSLYLGNQNGMLDTYDNFFGSDSQGTGVSDASITLSAYVKKGDTIRLESNLPSTTPWTDTFFCQTGLLAYNNNYD